MTALDVAIQHFGDEDVPDAMEKGLYWTVRDPKMERDTTYLNRERLGWRVLERFNLTALARVKGCTLRLFARMDDRSSDKLITWTGGSYDFETIMRAIVMLDRPDSRIVVQRPGGSQAVLVFLREDGDFDVTAPAPPIHLQRGLAEEFALVFMAQIALDEDKECDDGEGTMHVCVEPRGSTACSTWRVSGATASSREHAIASFLGGDQSIPIRRSTRE